MEKEFKNLKDFADELSEKIGEKMAFVRKVSVKCGISVNTVLNYLRLDSKPRKASILTKLSEMTGIPETDLFRRHENEFDEL